ncbi:MAG TPA: hypothetical protein O0X25_02050 [Methanocorpusculum sp.]|nr:hypothetical protein [Methanocorpusculum sp.]HJJ39775.1 hypothetical protein [Methanocorpusculum sp.]HJJ49385.1 hypothetical protein [Methanocorpusculum sp.]HJJ56571.1 hypothetical protein [Methanocorpusculum sp.]HJJ95704.1 hypothetical protein [Methanocorpusculum sp.]
MPAQYYETEDKKVSYLAIGFQTASAITAIPTLLFSIEALGLGTSSLRTIFWWIAFICLVIGVIFEYISSKKQIGSSRITGRASLIGIVAALLLVISTFVGMM